MTVEDIIKSVSLPAVVLNLIEVDEEFKNELIASETAIAADIESSATNPNCSCRNKVATYVSLNNDKVGRFIYDYATRRDLVSSFEILLANTKPLAGTSATGRVAKTSISDWPNFVRGINQANLSFDHMSTSIVGDDVFVFFL
jgi:hypothetical protein